MPNKQHVFQPPVIRAVSHMNISAINLNKLHFDRDYTF